MKQTYKVPASIAWRQVEDEIVVLDLNTSVYYSFNETGARMWELFAKSETPETVAVEISKEFGEDAKTVAADVEEFLKGLTKEKLLQPA